MLSIDYGPETYHSTKNRCQPNCWYCTACSCDDYSASPVCTATQGIALSASMLPHGTCPSSIRVMPDAAPSSVRCSGVKNKQVRPSMSSCTRFSYRISSWIASSIIEPVISNSMTDSSTKVSHGAAQCPSPDMVQQDMLARRVLPNSTPLPWRIGRPTLHITLAPVALLILTIVKLGFFHPVGTRNERNPLTDTPRSSNEWKIKCT
jgi:hypothetical protein